MMHLLEVLCLALALRSEVPFVESQLRFDGELLGYETPLVNADGLGDLVVIVGAGGQRSLLLFLQREDGSFPSSPDWRLSVPPEVVAYACFDVREEPGRELLLLSATGIHSVSPTLPGLRGNLRSELRLSLFPDLAAGDELLRWPWVLDLDADGREELLVVSAGQLVILRVESDASGRSRLVPRGALPCRTEPREASGEVSMLGGQISVQTVSPVITLFPGTASSVPAFRSSSLLNQTREWMLPCLIDWNGDGLIDGVWTGSDGFEVDLQQPDGSFLAGPRPVLTAEILAGLEDDLRLLDLDGDGSVEVVALGSERDGLTGTYTLTVFPRTPGSGDLMPATARIKLSASQVRFRFHDVNADGRLDVVARVTELPGALATLTAARIDMSVLVFLGLPGGTFSRKPVARFERRMPMEHFARVRESQFMELGTDFNGDGLNDLLCLQSDGLLQVTPLTGGGDQLAFADQPLSNYRPPKPVRDARPAMLSPDEVSDLVLRHEDSLTVFVSRKPEQDR